MPERRPMRKSDSLNRQETPASNRTAEEVIALIELEQRQDSLVLEYVRERAKDRVFRDSLEQVLASVKKKPGRKPKNLPPKAFYHLIRAIKTQNKCRTIEAALTLYCHAHGLPEEEVSNLKDRYRDGRVKAIEGK